MMGQPMEIGRTVGSPKVPTLKGTEVSLYSVSCIFFNEYLYFSYYVAGYLVDTHTHIYIINIYRQRIYIYSQVLEIRMYRKQAFG